MTFFECLKFVGIEGVVTAIVDWIPHHLRRGYRKELFTAFICLIWFLIGLSMVTEVQKPFLLCSVHSLYSEIVRVRVFLKRSVVGK